MIILTNSELVKSNENVNFAESLLLEFVMDFQQIYGERSVTFNVHNLIHICKDVANFGALDSYSAYPFESYLCSIKKLIRKGDKPLEKIARRLEEYESINSLKIFRSIKLSIGYHAEKIHYNGVLPNSMMNIEVQYKVLSFTNWKINIDDDRNNTVMLQDSSVIFVLNIIKSGKKNLL